MKTVKLIGALLLLGIAGLGNAWADHHGHVRFGITIGPYWGPGYFRPYPYYYPPYYPGYYPPVVIERPAPQVYIEQQPAPVVAPAMPTATAPANFWYYCAASQAYYPYVKECPGGWQRVSPQPPG